MAEDVVTKVTLTTDIDSAVRAGSKAGKAFANSFIAQLRAIDLELTRIMNRAAATRLRGTPAFLDAVDRTSTGTDFTFPGTNANDLNVGRRGDGNHYLEGSIAHYAIYGTALSSARVTAHFDAADDVGEPPVLRTIQSNLRW